MSDSAADVQILPGLVEQVARYIGADIVHANQFAAACADVDVPVILTLHSDVLSWRRWTCGANDVPAEWQAYAGLVRKALNRAVALAAVSDFLGREIAQLYETKRTVE